MSGRKYNKSSTKSKQGDGTDERLLKPGLNLHVSTSLPGPLTGYKRKRTQAVQAGDDSEFYTKTYLRRDLNKRRNETAPSECQNEEDDEDISYYDEPNGLASVTTISQQTSPIKLATFGSGGGKNSAKSTPTKASRQVSC